MIPHAGLDFACPVVALPWQALFAGLLWDLGGQCFAHGPRPGALASPLPSLRACCGFPSTCWDSVPFNLQAVRELGESLPAGVAALAYQLTCGPSSIPSAASRRRFGIDLPLVAILLAQVVLMFI